MCNILSKNITQLHASGTILNHNLSSKRNSAEGWVVHGWLIMLDTYQPPSLTHWGRVTHTCVSKLIVIGSDNGLSPGRHQAIIWTNAGILSIGPLETNFSEILIKIIIVSFKKMRLKVLSAIRQPFCFGLNVLNQFYWKAMSQYAKHLNYFWSVYSAT